MSDDTYNGWSNYETWCANLWISNDQGSDEIAREFAEEADGDTYALSQTLEAWIDEYTPELEPSMFSDMLNASLRCVNWYEIAEVLLSTLAEEA